MAAMEESSFMAFSLMLGDNAGAGIGGKPRCRQARQ